MNVAPQAKPLEECAPRDFDLAAAAARGKPLVIRGLVRDWPIVKLALQSDTAFAQRLAELDNGADCVFRVLCGQQAFSLIRYV